MDPITAAIVAALSAGVASGAGEVGKKVIVDAYGALKAAIKSKYGAESDVAEAVSKLEEKPDSTGRRSVMQEEVTSADAAADSDLQELAQKLLGALEETPQGRKALSKYQVEVSGGKVGAIGDGAQVEMH